MWLSLAARGGALKIGSLANMKSSPGGGAIAVRTVPLLLKGALFPAKAQPVPAAPAAN